MKFRDISILKKITFAYIIFILTPACFILFYNLNQTREIIKTNGANQGNKLLNEVTYNINKKINAIENLSNNICYNSEIISYLKSEDYVTSIPLYNSRIFPIINYAIIYNQANLYTIRLFIDNKNIPEGRNYLFNAERIKNKQWYKDFINSNKKSIWFETQDNLYFENDLKLLELPSFIFAQKIDDYYGNYLGIMTTVISKDELFSQSKDKQNRDFFIIDNNNDNILTFESKIHKENIEILKNYINEEDKDYYKIKDKLYVCKELKDLNIMVGTEVFLYNNYTLYINLIIIVIIIILFILYHLYIRTIFFNINNMIKIMNRVVHGEFDLRIPIRNKNEIGIIAISFNSMIEKINALIKDIVKKETIQKDTQLKALQYQISPHFIYNTLDMFASELELEKNYVMSEAISYFGKMLRYNMKNKTLNSTIQFELDYVRNYITIQKIKYKDNLNLNISVSQELTNCKMMKFILQPIVENSIVHSKMYLDKDILSITIIIRKTKSQNISFEIFDNGPGIEKEKLQTINLELKNSEVRFKYCNEANGIGLSNINERLKLFYGEDYYIQLESKINEYTKTIFAIPIVI